MQRVGLLAEVRDLVHVGRADQPSVEVVGPRVVGALDAAAEGAMVLGAQFRTAMPAHVIERVDLSGAIAGDDDALAEYLAQDELTGLFHLLDASGADPL